MNIGYQNRKATPTLSSEVGGFYFGDGRWVMGYRCWVLGKMDKKKVESYEDLDVYQNLVDLHLRINDLTLTFPKFELYELGSQIRRSSNSAPANLAEGWNNKHINIYLEGINRALSEINETKHHLFVAFKKNYLDATKYQSFIDEYNTYGRMLSNLKRSLMNVRTLGPNTHHPAPNTYHPTPITQNP